MTRMISGLKRGQVATLPVSVVERICRESGLKTIPVWIELSDGRALSLRRQGEYSVKVVLL